MSKEERTTTTKTSTEESVEFVLFPIQRNKKTRVSDRNKHQRMGNPLLKHKHEDDNGDDDVDDDDEEEEEEEEEDQNREESDDEERDSDEEGEYYCEEETPRDVGKTELAMTPSKKKKHEKKTTAIGTLKERLGRNKKKTKDVMTPDEKDPEHDKPDENDNLSDCCCSDDEEDDEGDSSSNIKLMLHHFKNASEEIRVLKQHIKDMEKMVREKEKELKDAKQKISKNSFDF